MSAPRRTIRGAAALTAAGAALVAGAVTLGSAHQATERPAVADSVWGFTAATPAPVSDPVADSVAAPVPTASPLGDSVWG